MKNRNILISIVFCLSCLAGGRAEVFFAADTVNVPQQEVAAADSTVNEKKQLHEERKADRKEAIKNESEHIKTEIKDAATELEESVKEELQNKKEAIKESFSRTKANLTEWFNENIAANTVGEFAEIQRQNNQAFCDYIRSPWEDYTLEIRERNQMEEGMFFTGKSPKNGTDSVLVVQVVSVIEPLKHILPPVPENYYEGAGTEAVSNLVSKQQFAAFKFYGQDIKVYYNPTIRNINLGKGLEKGVAKVWQYLSDQEFDPVLFQLYQYKEELGLNDYQYYLLTRQFADLVFNKAKKGENLIFTVFLLNQTGYDARIAQFQGEGGSQLAVLLPFFEEVAYTPYLRIGNNSYYLMDIMPGKKLAQSSVKVYNKAHANATHPISIRNEPQNAKIAPIYGKFQGYTFDERMAQMQTELPAGPMELYADADFSDLMNKTFLYKLLPETDSMVSKRQDANLKDRLSEREIQEIKIINVSQFLNRALSSQTKQSARLGTRHLYPETMFFKRGSGDILDRSILLCHISNRILKIPAILVVYPNFAMAAVCLADGESSPESPFYMGDYVEWNGKKYYLCGKLPKAVKEPGAALIYRW
ncbi:MAG: hypothetical protein J1F29_04175 [Lentimicrobiaceae bacterium]|nr:hypothetical protein [Lentimicrobiaceae bacterium]